MTALAELSHAFDSMGISYWLFGGWAVDFHAGTITREHGDIDIAVMLDDMPLIRELLHDTGWTHDPSLDDVGVTGFNRNGVRLELAFLACDANGRRYTPLEEGRGEWPIDSFGNESAELDGIRVRVVGRASLIADKSVLRPGTQTAEKD